MRKSSAQYAELCAERTGPSLGFVDTDSAARDMDVMRALLGDKKLNYLGYSYGTALGAHYAELFPQNVGRLVLDGALDPALTNEEITMGQAVGFKRNPGLHAELPRVSRLPVHRRSRVRVDTAP